MSFNKREANKLYLKYLLVFTDDLKTDLKLILEKYKLLLNVARNTSQRYRNYTGLIEKLELKTDHRTLFHSRKNIDNIISLLEKKINKYHSFKINGNTTLDLVNNLFLENSEIFRCLLSELALYQTQFDWRSPAYKSSLYSNIFSYSELNIKKINYARYGDKETKLEKNVIKSWYKNTKSQLRCLSTASGMSAYTVVEDFLLKYHIKKGGVVLTIPYIYFEVFEQLNILHLQKYIMLHQTQSYDAIDICKDIDKYNPSVIFIDLMTNNGNIATVDLEIIYQHLAKKYQNKKIYVISDNTMTPTYNPFLSWEKYLNPENKNGPRLIVYESGNKYRQLGLDLTNAGFMTSYQFEVSNLHRSRRNTGQNLSDYSNYIFPIYNKKVFNMRMSRIQRNALLVCEIINDRSKYFNANHPLIENNKFSGISLKYNICSGIVTFIFTLGQLNNKLSYDKLILAVLSQAKQKGISVSNGLSFGFDVSRISASASMAENTTPFLRLSCGTENIYNTILMAKCIRDEADKLVLNFLAQNNIYNSVSFKL